MITFLNTTDKIIKLDTNHKIWLNKVIRNENKIPGNIDYLFCDDDYMLERNLSFLNHDTYTDIITFDDCVGDVVSGNILISLNRVTENSEKFGKTFENELLRVVAHGVLHLCGYKDKTDIEARVMREKEDEALRLFYL